MEHDYFPDLTFVLHLLIPLNMSNIQIFVGMGVVYLSGQIAHLFHQQGVCARLDPFKSAISKAIGLNPGFMAARTCQGYGAIFRALDGLWIDDHEIRICS